MYSGLRKITFYLIATPHDIVSHLFENILENVVKVFQTKLV